MNRRIVYVVGITTGWVLRERFVGTWTKREYALARKLQEEESKVIDLTNDRQRHLRMLRTVFDNLEDHEGSLTESLRIQMKNWLVEYAKRYESQYEEDAILDRAAINTISGEFSSRLVKLVTKRNGYAYTD